VNRALGLVTAALAAVVLASACKGRAAEDPDLPALRAEVATLREAAEARFRSDTLLAPLMADSTTIAVGLRVVTVRDLLAAAVPRYLQDVKLHIRPNVVVREEDEVRVRVGPVSVYAGRWHLAVTIRRVDARLRADSIDLVVTRADRIEVTVPVHVVDGSGDALIDFRWDAARVTGVVCGDFAVREEFSGYVEPRTYRMRGRFELITEDGALIARPVVEQRIPVSPQPTQASWERVRTILNEQNHIFKCGIALSPERMETMLRELLTKGFRFRLPSSILRPVPLPASLLDEVDVAGRRARVTVRPQPPLLTADWLWLRANVDVTASGDAPILLDSVR
jgi:hypothetical protein